MKKIFGILILLPLVTSCAGNTYAEILDSYFAERFREKYLQTGNVDFFVDNDIWTYEISGYPEDGVIKQLTVYPITVGSGFTEKPKFGGYSYYYNINYLSKSEQSANFVFNVKSEKGEYNKDFNQVIKIKSYKHYMIHCLGEHANLTNVRGGGVSEKNGQLICSYGQQYISSGHFYTDISHTINFTTNKCEYKITKYEHNTSGSYNYEYYTAYYDLLSGTYTYTIDGPENAEYVTGNLRTWVNKLNKVFTYYSDFQYIHTI
ncbi:MAG: hypothetical protein IKB70_01855 [Bacilli bacterium]|nr:hypothetical protein [Bacilli bacterium]